MIRSFDQKTKIWNVTHGKCDSIFSGHEMEVVCLQFDSMSTQLLTGSMDKIAKTWNIEIGQMKHDGEVISCSFNTEGDKILNFFLIKLQKFGIYINCQTCY